MSNVDGGRDWSETNPIFNAWLDNETLLADSPNLEGDYKSGAYGELAGYDLMIITDKGVWGVWNGLHGLALLDRILLEATTCNSWSDSAATLNIQSYSTSSLERNVVFNAVDGNASGHCPFGHSGDYASDSAVLAFADISALASPVGVQLVEDQEAQVFGCPDELEVPGPRQDQLLHDAARQQSAPQVRRPHGSPRGGVFVSARGISRIR